MSLQKGFWYSAVDVLYGRSLFLYKRVSIGNLLLAIKLNQVKLGFEKQRKNRIFRRTFSIAPYGVVYKSASFLQLD